MSSRSVQLIGGPDRDEAHVTPGNRLMVDMALGDSPSIDAFDRLRVANPVTIFDSILSYDKQPIIWWEQIDGGATSVHQPLEAAVKMSVSTSGDRVIRQTKEFFRYQPGKSQFILMTWVCDSADPNVRRRVGYFETNNGIFYEEVNGESFIVLRSGVTGSVVDTRIAQADWNKNTFPELDPSKTQILAIDLQWLGVGRVRVGFVIDGILTYAHEFLNANVRDVVYMTTGQLPARIELEATGAIAATYNFWGICTSVMSEGGIDEGLGFPFAANTGAPASYSGTRVPLMSIRPKATFNGIINRVQTIQREIQAVNTGNGTAVIEVIHNGILTGPTWLSVSPDSSLEYDVSATAITGGHSVLAFYVAASNQSAAAIGAQLRGKYPLSLDIDGLNPINLSAVVTTYGTCVVGMAGSWQEYR